MARQRVQFCRFERSCKISEFRVVSTFNRSSHNYRHVDIQGLDDSSRGRFSDVPNLSGSMKHSNSRLWVCNYEATTPAIIPRY